jgi:hypothetical protein
VERIDNARRYEILIFSPINKPQIARAGLDKYLHAAYVLKRHVLLTICSDTPAFISGASEPSEP